ncbi:MAG: CPBP family intramembrane metalloprotease [Luminiphilus sp.]|nr:CPBP family intramembrane metalloprotease [Luminiphilus sp.]
MLENTHLSPKNDSEGVFPESQGRLQRDAPDGTKITSFTQVFVRHGLLMLALAGLFVLFPTAFADLSLSLTGFFASPHYYGLAFLALWVFLIAYSQLSDKVVNRKQLTWIGYLLFISIAEEWIFRLALPNLLTGHLAPIYAVVMSNIIFAAIHFFTLRWRLIWVVFAFLGGLGLSRVMTHGDLLVVIWLHWIGTFLNTPFPPGLKQLKEKSAPLPRD